jgi:hypothetical protein
MSMQGNYAIKVKKTTSYNADANATIEQVHKIVNVMLKSFDLENEQNHENLEEK